MTQRVRLSHERALFLAEKAVEERGPDFTYTKVITDEEIESLREMPGFGERPNVYADWPDEKIRETAGSCVYYDEQTGQ